MGRVIADFYCAECKLIIEVDGSIHATQTDYDQLRTEEIEKFGYRVIRFNNDDIEKNINKVLKKILKACKTPLLPKSGEGAGG